MAEEEIAQKSITPQKQTKVEEVQAGCHKQTISQCIGHSFLIGSSDGNRIVFISDSLQTSKSLAFNFLKSVQNCTNHSYNQITILIDFNPEEIEEINFWLSTLILQAQISKQLLNNLPKEGLKVKRLNQVLIEKRRSLYLTAGVYSVSSQIFLTDLLRGEQNINPKYLSGIIIKSSHKIKDHFNYLAWICTIIALEEKKDEQKWKVPIVLLIKNIHHYADERELERIYRTFFCKKIVIWPFGRAEIHRAMTAVRKESKIKQFEHRLHYNSEEKEMHEVLMGILTFLRKSFNSMHKTQLSLEEFIYSEFNVEMQNEQQQEIFMRDREYTEIHQMRCLLMMLDNCPKIQILIEIKRARLQDATIWNSNNSTLLELTDKLFSILKNTLFGLQRCKEDQFLTSIDLQSILAHSPSLDNPENLINLLSWEKERQQYTCSYTLKFSMQVNFKENLNQKLKQLLKIINNQLNPEGEIQKQEQENNFNETNLLNELFERQLSGGMKNSSKLFIFTENEVIRNSLHKSLHEVAEKCEYTEFLRNVYTYLSHGRSYRLAKLKKMYERQKVRKVKMNDTETIKGEINEPEKEIINKKSKKSWVELREENECILEEQMCMELEGLFGVIVKYEEQYNIYEEKTRQIEESNQIRSREEEYFNLKHEQRQLKKEMQKEIKSQHFQLLAKDEVQISKHYRSNHDILFSHQETNLKVIVASGNGRQSKITHFNVFLRIVNPEKILLYSPNTHLLRNVYLHHYENSAQSNLSELHILAFHDSFEIKSMAYYINRQDRAFWNIANHRKQLNQFIQTPFLRIQSLDPKDSYSIARESLRARKFLPEGQKVTTNQINLSTLVLSPYKKVILVDSRQFKSSLPSHLFHFGFTIVPIFLESGDYVLSSDIGVEKKSIHTRDLHQSLRSRRLDEQLLRMVKKFKKSYLLIECEEESHCKKHNFLDYNADKDPAKHRNDLRRRIIELIRKFPSVKLIWSTSLKRTCEFFRELKMNNPQPDLKNFGKQSGQNMFESEKEKEVELTIVKEIQDEFE